tara:strand:- start:13762 stop:14043 length:282 start_codon:yes stop_codon:yes gene_type:complete
MKEPLYKHLIEIGKKSLYIKELKGVYAPVELASQLSVLVEQKMIGVDWERKKINVYFNIEKMLSKKSKVNNYKRTVPQHMKSKKKEVNKPYLK